MWGVRKGKNRVSIYWVGEDGGLPHHPLMVQETSLVDELR